MNPTSEPKEKKPYSAPKLIVYGNILSLTQQRSNMGMMDGGVNVNFDMSN